MLVGMQREGNFCQVSQVVLLTRASFYIISHQRKYETPNLKVNRHMVTNSQESPSLQQNVKERQKNLLTLCFQAESSPKSIIFKNTDLQGSCLYVEFSVLTPHSGSLAQCQMHSNHSRIVCRVNIYSFQCVSLLWEILRIII